MKKINDQRLRFHMKDDRFNHIMHSLYIGTIRRLRDRFGSTSGWGGGLEWRPREGEQRYQRDGEITPSVPVYYRTGNQMRNESYQLGRVDRGMIARVKRLINV